jgi:hypothetical protein
MGMSKKAGQKKSHPLTRKRSTLEAANPAPPEQSSSPTGLNPRISYKNALILITFCSLAMAGLTIFQYGPAIGWIQAILYGLLYGVLLWGVFFIALFFFRWLRKKQGL